MHIAKPSAGLSGCCRLTLKSRPRATCSACSLCGSCSALAVCYVAAQIRLVNLFLETLSGKDLRCSSRSFASVFRTPHSYLIPERIAKGSSSRIANLLAPRDTREDRKTRLTRAHAGPTCRASSTRAARVPSDTSAHVEGTRRARCASPCVARDARAHEREQRKDARDSAQSKKQKSTRRASCARTSRSKPHERTGAANWREKARASSHRHS